MSGFRGAMHIKLQPKRTTIKRVTLLASRLSRPRKVDTNGFTGLVVDPVYRPSLEIAESYSWSISVGPLETGFSSPADTCSLPASSHVGQHELLREPGLRPPEVSPHPLPLDLERLSKDP